ncbi:MAG: hypothetical protein HKN24_06675 [Acidimicrobiales bacterium]|nr:hypothetical protein [Acidimicrobiales bacterium]
MALTEVITTFLTLRLRLLRNIFATDGALAFVLFSTLALLLSVSVAAGIARAGSIPSGVFPLLGAAVLISWTFGPLLFGASDETIDSTRLALFPVPARQLAPGMALAGLVGPGPLAVTLPFLAAAFRGEGALRILAGILSAVATVVLASVLSRWVQTELGELLRARSRRDLVILFGGLFAGIIGLGSQILLFVGLSAERLEGWGRVARWLPGGWTGWGQELLHSDPSGRAIITSLGMSGLSLAVATFAAWRWIVTLERALTEVGESAADDLGHTHFMDSGGPVGVLLDRLGPMGPVFAKEVRYLRRHPRYRVQVVSQFVVLILGGAPFLAAILDRDPVSVLVGCVPALTAGITSSNLLGADGRALWAEVLAIDSLKVILRGRALAFFLLGIGASGVVIFGTAAWTGGWRYVPVALAASVGMGFAGAGTGAYTSTLAPVLLPDESNPNPFASGDMGQGCVSGIYTFGGAFVGLLSAAPILVGLAFARTEVWAQLLVVFAAPVYGLLLFYLATEWAGRRTDPRIPDLLASLTTAS